MRQFLLGILAALLTAGLLYVITEVWFSTRN